MTDNVPKALAAEIRRVATIRAAYEEMGRQHPRIMVAPAIALMDMALDQAIEAAGICDALIQIDALKELQGFER